MADEGTAEPGVLLRVVKDRRVATLLVGALNTAIAYALFVAFQWLIGSRVQPYGYLIALGATHVVGVLCAFALQRRLVFRVHGHVWRDLARFESVNLVALGVNVVVLQLLVELGGLPPILAQLIVLVATTLISGFGHRYFSFRMPAVQGDGPPPEGPS